MLALRRTHRIGLADPGGRPHRRRAVHRTPHPGPRRTAAAGGVRPGHRRTHPPLRTLPPRRPGPHRRQKAQPQPRTPADTGPLGHAAGRVNRHRDSGAGCLYLHTALDDHSRLAYTEILADQTAATCACVPGPRFLSRATQRFAARSLAIRRVLTDNA
ncbi:hypothetical protein Arub01_28830 [Actinomadura rubrobrunea]|uniref:DDE-type integrase/transposase/recombinase n=1 Tax=Actinomadura rubrobrunea TaxID=115335 RepID=A0A9W6UV51_9ACTN|nr:hypothetical protein Arub01_28830 [Actinomadura rubrobrunea]